MAGFYEQIDQDGNRIGWQAKVRKKGFPSQTKVFRTKAEAQAWSASVEGEMARGIWRDRSESERTTLAECIERYLSEVTPHKKHSHQEALKLGQWLRRPIAKRFMASIRGKDVADVIKDMESEGKAGNTIRLHLAVLSHLFKVAKTEWGMEALSNPCEAVRKPKLPKGRDRRLVGDEESRLLAACREDRNPWLLPVVRFAIETAMRAGEILETSGKADPETGTRAQESAGLRWSDVDLKRRTAHLPTTKNGEARTVPLTAAAVEVLQGLVRSLDGKVFCASYGRIHQAFVRACARAGITGLTFHDLRHEATSRLFERGFNPMEVSTITGHKTLQMLKRYTHLRAEDLAKRMG